MINTPEFADTFIAATTSLDTARDIAALQVLGPDTLLSAIEVYNGENIEDQTTEDREAFRDYEGFVATYDKSMRRKFGAISGFRLTYVAHCQLALLQNIFDEETFGGANSQTILTLDLVDGEVVPEKSIHLNDGLSRLNVELTPQEEQVLIAATVKLGIVEKQMKSVQIS